MDAKEPAGSRSQEPGGAACPHGANCSARFTTSTGEARPGELHASAHCTDCGRGLHATFTIEPPESPHS